MNLKFKPEWLVILCLLALGAYWIVQGDRGGQGVTGEVTDIYRAPMDDRKGQCDEVAGTAEERLDLCLARLAPFELSDAAKETIRQMGDNGKIFVVGDQLAQQLPQQIISENAAIRDLMMGTDEEAVATALREAGVRGLVVHRDITGALDRDSVVLSRLAHHDFLEWFQLKHVEWDAYVYSVRRSPARLALSTGDMLLKGLRARLADVPAPRQEWQPKSIRLIGTMRLQGATVVMRHASGDNVEAVLDELAAKMSKRWAREVATEGTGLLVDRLNDVRLEIHVVMERAPVQPRTAYQIFDIWEMGVDGMMFSHREGVKNQKFTYMPGSELIVRSMKSTEDLFQYATKMFGWRDSHPWRDPKTRLHLIRDQHFAEGKLGGGTAIRLFRGMPEEPLASLTDKKIQQMLVDGGEWWLNNMQSDGSFNYKYWPSQNRLSSDYNEVRHILATRDLADTWRYRKDSRYLDGSKQAMDWLLKYQIHDTDEKHAVLPHPREGSMLFRYPLVSGEVPGKAPNQKLGTVAVALLGWVAWAESTGDHSEDERIRKMADFVLSQAEDNGKFTAYYVDALHPYYNNKNDIVPGEAALALGEVAEYFDEPKWLEFFPKFLDYYEPWFRERAERKNPYGRWPHNTYDNNTRLDLVQFGPWSVMANKQYYSMTGDARAAAFGLEVADWMIDNYQWTTDRSPWPDFIGGYYKIPQELPAMQTFCYSEGTAAAYQIASKFKPEQKGKYDMSTREAIRFLRVMQFDETDSYFAADPDLIHGGIKYAMNEQKIRIDYVGHGLSTLSQYLDAKEYDPAASLDLTVDTVTYSDIHESIWGAWKLSKIVLRNAPEMNEEQKEAMQKQFDQFAKLSTFNVGPDVMVQSLGGRRQKWSYTVTQSSDDSLVVLLRADNGRSQSWQIRHDSVENAMYIFDGRVERVYGRP